MADNHSKESSEASLDKRLGTPMKKIDGLSSDKKKAESEHLHAFREDVSIGNEEEQEEEDEENK